MLIKMFFASHSQLQKKKNVDFILLNMTCLSDVHVSCQKIKIVTSLHNSEPSFTPQMQKCKCQKLTMEFAMNKYLEKSYTFNISLGSLK